MTGFPKVVPHLAEAAKRSSRELSKRIRCMEVYHVHSWKLFRNATYTHAQSTVENPSGLLGVLVQPGAMAASRCAPGKSRSIPLEAELLAKQ